LRLRQDKAKEAEERTSGVVIVALGLEAIEVVELVAELELEVVDVGDVVLLESIAAANADFLAPHG
jgi:hypothetical protein